MEGAEPLYFLVPLKNILLHEYQISFRKNNYVTTQRPHLRPQSAFAMVPWEAMANLPAWLFTVSPKDKFCSSSSFALVFAYNMLPFGSGAFPTAL